MNQMTPGKMRGSLLERAGSLYDFSAPPSAPPIADPAPTAPPQTDLATRTATPPPRVRGAQRRVAIDRDQLAERGMLLPGGPVTALAEEFRMVKRQLLLTSQALAAGDPARSRMILVSSAQPNEGKTFCAINLAMSLAAEKDVEILLVDADFAKPDIVATLGVEDGPGLLDAIADPQADVEDHILATDIAQLSVLPAGARSNSDTELLASKRGRQVIESLAAADPRRIVLFDSPPILAASHASVLASLVGQVLVVVRADGTSESDLRDAVAGIDTCEHIHLTLNAVTYQPGGRRLGTYYGEQPK
ncbi:AAA family ATPase [Sphingomonas japonica]|uniref:Exopolysaccharide/PEP-CTERM locus tyrosine autokinase n=1 Tax=Sphingomonas japonica TaxID=511662 RepID=A0ABX0U4Q0_9SPHN|nr:AAA family ATPase [Sphingomonas japonica]NIJ25030.1 exopolysaccharide/PEP-CTERM locus tyrosine autokinase [Sphingomonas japonica]